jgi:asparagine synthase (glutamine-hydrolysing)
VRVFFEKDSTLPEGFSAASAFDLAGFSGGECAYWSLQDEYVRGAAKQTKISFPNAVDELETILTRAVRRQRVADVPVGAFLSGGVDSSTVVALLQKKDKVPVRTFTIGVEDPRLNEAQAAQRIALALGTQHTELMISEKEILDTVPRMGRVYDEPFADSSQIPTHLLSLLARRHVTVSLSGDGGDELFGGYVRYFIGQKLFRRIGFIPRFIRPSIGRALSSVPLRNWRRLVSPWSAERIHKVARVLSGRDSDAMYFELVRHWTGVVIGGVAPQFPLTARESWPPLTDPVERMMYFDQISYLPDDILTKVDRASMAASLEAREPLLDYRLVELAWTLPLSMKVRNGRGKLLLRHILKRYVPDSFIERPKMGFGIPLEEWLRGPLRDWAESLLDSAALRAQGFLEVQPVRAKWNELLAGRGDWKHHVWAVLMFQAWLNESNG